MYRCLDSGYDTDFTSHLASVPWQGPSVQLVQRVPEVRLTRGYYFQNQRGETELFDACRKSNSRGVQDLIERGINVNHRNICGKTALYYTSEKKLGKLLMEHGAVCYKSDNYDIQRSLCIEVRRRALQELPEYIDTLSEVLSKKCIGIEVSWYISCNATRVDDRVVMKMLTGVPVLMDYDNPPYLVKGSHNVIKDVSRTRLFRLSPRLTPVLD